MCNAMRHERVHKQGDPVQPKSDKPATGKEEPTSAVPSPKGTKVTAV
jgi:hypothetical protein